MSGFGGEIMVAKENFIYINAWGKIIYTAPDFNGTLAKPLLK